MYKFCYFSDCLLSVDPLQCDQMDVLFIQYLAIVNNEICPKTLNIKQSRFSILPSTKQTCQK